MKLLLPLIAILPLSACSLAAERAVHMRDTGMLNVALDTNYYGPQSAATRGSDGQVHEIEVFPLVSALVVTRHDGSALSESDETLAREAVDKFCRNDDFDVPGPESRFSEGAWAFMPCTAKGS